MVHQGLNSLCTTTPSEDCGVSKAIDCAGEYVVIVFMALLFEITTAFSIDMISIIYLTLHIKLRIQRMSILYLTCLILSFFLF